MHTLTPQRKYTNREDLPSPTKRRNVWESLGKIGAFPTLCILGMWEGGGGVVASESRNTLELHKIYLVTQTGLITVHYLFL